MSVKSQVQAAEEALRQALINALAEGDEQYLSELFTQYQAVSDLNKKVQDKITFDSNFDFIAFKESMEHKFKMTL